MTLKDDLTSAVAAISGKDFVVTDGVVVPTTRDIGYDQARRLQATYLYADMVDSSGLVAIAPQETVGKVLRMFLDVTVRVIRARGGHIRSFDGDRVMGIFVGEGREDAAVKAALQINWACLNLLQPAIKRYSSIKNAAWIVRAGCGIASGNTLIVRGGVRRSDHSDLVSVGVAPNLAAKLSDVRVGEYRTRIGGGTYKALGAMRTTTADVSMWDGPHTLKMGGKSYTYYRSNYRWSIA